MQIVPLSAFRDNYIWALVALDQCIVVDPGESHPVLRFLQEHDLHLTAILVTHRHNDHIGGVGELRERWPVPVFGPPSIALVTDPVRDGDQINLPGIGGVASVLEVPGHTEEHVAFLHEGHLFCGDTLFAGGCGRLLGSSTAADLNASLNRISELPDQTLIYCAHEYTLSNLRFASEVEPDNIALKKRVQHCNKLRDHDTPTLPSLLADEHATNPFLRVNRQEVIGAIARHTGKIPANSNETFAALRAWKDVF